MSAYIEALPEECLLHILSLTLPEDIIRSSAVSKMFHSAAVSDDLWKNFLPSHYGQIISQSSSPLQFDSVKDLYRNHILIDQNTKSFSLDRRSWKKYYMLGSKSLTIVGGDHPQFWSWISVPESRFPHNALLESVCWLYVRGVLPAKLLSKNTSYGAYFVFKLTSNECLTGFEGSPIQVSPSETDEHGLPLIHYQPKSTNFVYLVPPEDVDSEEDIIVPVEREDGWMEIQMGTYQVGITCSETGFLKMKLRD